MDMGQKIYDLRIQKGMTLEELGDKVGVGKSTVRKWENGIIANMKRDKIAKLAEALGTSPAYLMGWDGEKSKDQKVISKSEQELIHKYNSIDAKGKHTVDTVLEMEYNRCNKSHLVVNAAHAIEGATEEELQHDNDIMNDDNF